MDSNYKLVKRLTKIWEKPDFSKFFKEFVKDSPRLIKKGTVLFNEGDPLNRVFYIDAGFVKLYRLSDGGRETTIYLYGPGQVLGVRALTSEDESARHYAEAITDLKVSTITRKEYFELVSKNPEYIVDLLHIFIERLNYTEKKLEGFIITDTTARVAYFLSDCLERFGKKEEGKWVIPLSLTHQRIAEFVGSFRETVTLALNKLTKEGILEDNRGKITVLDVKKLKAAAQKD